MTKLKLIIMKAENIKISANSKYYLISINNTKTAANAPAINFCFAKIEKETCQHRKLTNRPSNCTTNIIKLESYGNNITKVKLGSTNIHLY